MRKLNDVRTYMKKKFNGNEKLVPEARLMQQVIDLELLKYAMGLAGEFDEDIIDCIDACISGFIWLYHNGGTHDKTPEAINTNMIARQVYETFTMNWSRLQDYMRTHMYLMDA